MLKIINYLMNQKLFVNLIVFLILLAGYFTAKSLNREAYPEVNFDMVSIKIIYPGGSPEECEQLISIPIEKKLREVGGIDKVRSYNIENVSVVVVYIDDKVSNKPGVVQDIKDTVETVDNLPEKADKPLVEEIKLDKTMAIDIALFGKKKGVDYRELRDAADELEDFLYEIDGVAEVELFGYYDKEYLVEVEPSALEKYRIAMNTIINKLAKRNIDLPGGALRIGDEEYVLRTTGQYKSAAEIRQSVIMSNDMGYVTRVGEVASVTDTFKEPDVYERFNGHKAVILRVWKKRSADEIILVDRIRNSMKDYKPSNTDNVNIKLFNDTSRYTRDRLDAVVSNAITGFILLALILMLLLGLRMSSLVTASIPIAFMAAFFGMKAGGINFNVISLFGMIMVLGMIVDFGIVVSENSHRYMERGMARTESIKKGVAEVFWPVTVTFLCICAAFAPLLFISGLIGKFIKGIPIVLMMCLGASWLIANFILPTYLNIFTRASKVIEKKKKKARKEDPNFEPGAFGRVQRGYKRLLNIALEHRYLTTLILFFLLIVSLFSIRFIGFVFMPGGGEEEIQIMARFPQETNLDANLREMKKVEQILLKLPKEEFDFLHVTVGEEISSPLDPKPGEGTHKSTIAVNLLPEDDRSRNALEILKSIRSDILEAKKKGVVPENIKFEYEVKKKGPPIGKPVNVELRGKDFATLKKIAAEYMKYLKTVKGVSDIAFDLEEGKEEYRYVVDEVLASRTGVAVLDIAQALNASYQGAVATSVRDGEEDIAIRVRFKEKARKTRNSLNDVMIANQSGGLIPITMVSRINKQQGLTQINRLNFKRIVQVQAQVDTDIITPIKVNQMLAEKFKDVEKRYNGYLVSYGGEQEETSKRMGEMGVLFLFALLIIYIILAVFFKSLILPVVVMIAIPFAIIGIVFTLGVHREPMSFMSTLGFFSLAGVIVSNTLVLVQFINYQRDEGLSLKDALLEAGVIRLRPVILTSGTTVLGLFPSIYGLGGKDYFVAPLALAFGYGLIFATFITLVLIPCFYYLAEDIKGRFSGILARFGLNMGTTIYSKNTGGTE